jgi:uncharacterized protein YkwD
MYWKTQERQKAMGPMATIIVLYFVMSIGLTFGSRCEAISSQQDQENTSAAASGSESSSGGQRPPAEKSGKELSLSELVETLHQQVNEFRRAQGLKPLTFNPIISAQAREHSVDMARSGNTISHRRFDERLKEIREKLPYRGAAENVAISVGYENPAREAVEGWKKSPGHRKNMLGDYSLTGIGVARSQQGQYFFTQIFLEP